MNPNQVVLLFSNMESSQSIPLFEEIGIAGFKEKLMTQVFLDGTQSSHLHVQGWMKEGSHPLQKVLKQSIRGRIPFLKSDHFHSVLTAVKKKGLQEHFSKLHYLIISDEEVLSSLQPFTPQILCLIHPSASAASYLYSLAKKACENGESTPRIMVIMNNTDKIESAAELFAKLKEDVNSLMKNKVDLEFCGFLNPMEEKMALWEMGDIPLTELFAEDSLHGQMKYCLKRLRTLVPLTTDFSQPQEDHLLELASRLALHAKKHSA